MKRATLIVALFLVGVLAGFKMADSAPALCVVAVDQYEGVVRVLFAPACPADPREPFIAREARLRVPVCRMFVVVATVEGPKMGVPQECADTIPPPQGRP